MQPTESGRRDELTLAQIALRSGDSLRLVQQEAARWYARQFDGSVPRVRRVKEPGMLRWEYRVDTNSYEAFVLGQLKPNTLPVCASQQARLLGCTCERIPLVGRMGVVVAEDCPVHGLLVKAS